MTPSMESGLVSELSMLMVTSRLWLTDEAKKKEIRKFRDLLRKTMICLEDSPSLKRLFPLSEKIPPGLYPPEMPEELIPIPSYDLTADCLKAMIVTCDGILGTKEPTRYPRKKIIANTLELWRKYTGEEITPQSSIVKTANDRGKTTPPYRLCGLVLTIIEGKNIGDFSGIYNKIAGSKPFQKDPSPTEEARIGLKNSRNSLK